MAGAYPTVASVLAWFLANLSVISALHYTMQGFYYA